MKQSTAVLPRTRCHPKRVFWLKLLCVFAAASFAALLVCSPAVAQYLPWKIGEALSGQAPSTLLDAPFIDQRDKYPTGCESVTAVMALQYAGVDVTVEEFIDQYLPQGEAPHQDATGTIRTNPEPWWAPTPGRNSWAAPIQRAAGAAMLR